MEINEIAVIYIYVTFSPKENDRKNTNSRFYLKNSTPSTRVLSPFHGGEIVYLIDPNNYAEWTVCNPGKVSSSQTGRKVEVRQSSSNVPSFFLLTFLFSTFISPNFVLFLSVYITCFTSFGRKELSLSFSKIVFYYQVSNIID